MTTVALIPARSGSKSIRNKNIVIVGGKPLLVHSIEHALQSKVVDRVFVSTDSEQYRKLAIENGAEAPFLRPESISGDYSTDLDVFRHFVSWLCEREVIPDYLVHLRPTHPVRESSDIDCMVELLKMHPDADSVRSMSEAKQTPYKMWRFREDDENVMPVAACGISEAYNSPRQALPTVYMQNACIDVTRGRTVMEKNSMTGDRILGYKIPYDYDIDTPDEMVKADLFLDVQHALRDGKSLDICFDIDGVLACKTMDNDYAVAKPLRENIAVVNELYNKGHRIVLFTARGSQTGIDWETVTQNQMRDWGVKFHKLKFGKPAADLYIDDRNFSISELKPLF